MESTVSSALELLVEGLGEGIHGWTSNAETRIGDGNSDVRGYVGQGLEDLEPRRRRGPARGQAADDQESADDPTHPCGGFCCQFTVWVRLLVGDLDDDG